MPTYTIIPNATDITSQSQSQIQTNFQSIQTLVDVNHNDFSDGVNFGKHRQINFPVQTGLPGSPSTFAAGEVGLYNQLPTATPTTGVNELWINKNVSGGTAVQIPMTASILSTNNSPGTISNGWTYLPSGILLKWGSSSMPSGGSHSNSIAQRVQFPTGSGIPVFNQVFQIILSQNWGTNQTSLGSNGFGVYTGSGTFPTNNAQFYVVWSGTNSSGAIVSYLAIGY